MSDAPLDLITINDPRCAQTSPLLSTFDFGMAFRCAEKEGHDGQHHALIKWAGARGELGRVEAFWEGPRE